LVSEKREGCQPLQKLTREAEGPIGIFSLRIRVVWSRETKNKERE